MTEPLHEHFTRPDGLTVDLYCADCLDVLPTLGKVDAVVTDPPYGIADVWKGGGSHGWASALAQTPERNSWDKTPATKAHIGAILAVSQEQIIWGGNYFELPVSRGWLAWVKPERGFSLSEVELAWTNHDAVARVYECRRSDPDREHPTQKPRELMMWCIQKTGGVVCDPFMGSGTTGVAAVSLGRSFIGIEIEPKYYAIARRRILEALAQPALFYV